MSDMSKFIIPAQVFEITRLISSILKTCVTALNEQSQVFK